MNNSERIGFILYTRGRHFSHLKKNFLLKIYLHFYKNQNREVYQKYKQMYTLCYVLDCIRNIVGMLYKADRYQNQAVHLQACLISNQI